MIKIKDFRLKKENILGYVTLEDKKDVGLNVFIKTAEGTFSKVTIVCEDTHERDYYLARLDDIFEPNCL